VQPVDDDDEQIHAGCCAAFIASPSASSPCCLLKGFRGADKIGHGFNKFGGFTADFFPRRPDFKVFVSRLYRLYRAVRVV
jgi:hypothetical protein